MSNAARLLPIITVSLAASFSSGAATAKTTQYECTFDGRDNGWIPRQLVLTDNEATGKILVNDPIINTYVGTPIEAALNKRTKARVTYSWTIRTKSKSGQYADMRYTFSYFSNGLPAKIAARPGGYDNSFTGDGSCKVTQSG